jgi:guanosine-3',5'-bis(diphosphate) 3'-pyrophosphohydrolase
VAPEFLAFMITIQDIIKKAGSYLPKVNEKRLRAAFEYAQSIHDEHFRFSGEPYFHHLLKVVETLLSFKPDENTLIAALMHDFSKGRKNDFNDIIELFGHDVAFMVEGLEKINNISFRSSNTESETLRKMFLTMAGDLRVVLIRMADRLHNMETLDFVPEEKRKRIAKETLEIYAPIMARLGIYKLKWRLEDLAFKYLQPEEYADLKLQLDQYIQKEEKVMDFIQSELRNFLALKKIPAKVEGRLKNIYSMYKKLKTKNYSSLHDIFDIFAIRIILPDRLNKKNEELTDHLYALIGLIHSRWIPLPNRFKDYIALPKPNGYQSLHTTVLGLTPKPINKPTEIQVRSEKMDRESNFGIASHWLYKENDSFEKGSSQHQLILGENQSDQTFLADFVRLQSDLHQKKIIKPLNVDIFQDRIFVITPGGDIKDLPKGATPVDFAYAVHSDMGHCCHGAKVNNEIVPLDYELKNGEVVEILLNNKPGPKPHWLSFVKTALARNKIKSFLKSLDKDQSFREGKEIINHLLAELGYPPLDENFSVFKKYNNKKLSLKDRMALLAEVGDGSVSAQTVLKKIYGPGLNANGAVHSKPAAQKEQQNLGEEQDKKNKISIAGENDVPYKFSLCCKPHPGEPIIAYISRGKAVRIHLQSCRVLKNVEQARTLEANWDETDSGKKQLAVKILVKARDRVGLIRDIADVIASHNVNILDFSLHERSQNIIHREMTLEISNKEQLTKILKTLIHVRNVLKAEKVN